MVSLINVPFVVLLIAVILLLAPVTEAFHPIIQGKTSRQVSRKFSSPALFAAAKPPASKDGKKEEVDASKFWPGEWVRSVLFWYA